MADVSVPRVVGSGLLCAAVFGVIVWLYLGNALWSLAFGLAFGACMAAVLWNLWGSTAFEGLDFDQRKRVVKALRRGEPMHDPQLAPAVLKQGKVILSRRQNPKAVRIGLAVVFLLSGVAAAFSIAEDGWRGWTTGVPLMVISLVVLFVGLPMAERERQRAAQSVAETEKIHGEQAL